MLTITDAGLRLDRNIGIRIANNLAVLLLAALPSFLAPPVTAAEFAARALPAVTVEEPYAFVKRLSEWQEPPRRNPPARLSAQERALPAAGWKLVINADACPVLKQAADDFHGYLESGMQVHFALESLTSLEGRAAMQHAIIGGTSAQMPAAAIP